MLRNKRSKPFRDEKIITAWNAQMISALVSGFQVSREQGYLDAAIKTYDFITQHLYRGSQLLRVFKDGQSKFRAYLDDHALLLVAVMDLYEATGNRAYIKRAEALARYLVDQFWDEQGGGFFYTAEDHEPLIERTKPYYDQSMPSGNATAALALNRLAHLTQRPEIRHKAERTLRVFAKEMETQPQAMASMIEAAVYFLASPQEIHLVANKAAPETEQLLKKIHRLLLPNKILILTEPGLSTQNNSETRTQINGLPTVYLCQNKTCSPPMTTWTEIEQAMMRETPSKTKAVNEL